MCLEEAGLECQVPSMRKIDGGTWIRGTSNDLASLRAGTQRGLTQLAPTLESRGLPVNAGILELLGRPLEYP